jgi:hypothetical protein
MSKWKKVVLSVVAVLGVCVIVFICGLMYLFQGMCRNYIHKTIESPEATLKAVIFQRDCGATTGFSTQISILSVNEQLGDDSGNIFSSDGHPEESAPEVTWVNEEELNIKKRFPVQIYSQESSWGWLWNKVEISYK